MADIKYSGPLFDGRGDGILEDFTDESERNIAKHVHGRLRMLFVRNFKHRSGRYESTVKLRRHGSDIEVGDNGIVYGPWLEGTSKKNRTTRFRGYGIFRKTFQTEERLAMSSAEVLFARKYEERF